MAISLWWCGASSISRNPCVKLVDRAEHDWLSRPWCVVPVRWLSEHTVLEERLAGEPERGAVKNLNRGCLMNFYLEHATLKVGEERKPGGLKEADTPMRLSSSASTPRQALGDRQSCRKQTQQPRCAKRSTLTEN
eukprot:360488-Chlamydomonas_euryale.AAC.14